MQTFLPFETFSDSMLHIDNKRLGNQVYREGLTLLGGGWKNHPASKMWRGFECALAHYCLRGAMEMVARNYWKDEVCTRWITYFQDKTAELEDTGNPPWLGDGRLHASHRANLLRKDPEYYGKFGWSESPDMEYYWPV
jgi:hypothetical protein